MDPKSPIEPKILMVSMAIGEQYLRVYSRFFRRNQEAYARHWGYDFRIITEFIDRQLPESWRKSAVSFQKALVCRQAEGYDYVLFVDADIWINPISPPIHDLFPLLENRIGIVDEWAQPTAERRVAYERRCGWETSPKEYYALCGFEVPQATQVFNTGVLVLQPRIHGPFLEAVYARHIRGCVGHPRGFHYEQSAIGAEIIAAGMAAVLPAEFNAIWYLAKKEDPAETLTIEVFGSANYFVHFAGKIDYDLTDRLPAATEDT